MTSNTMHGFVEALRSDEQLARGLSAAVANKPEAETAQAVAAYARQHGFNITTEDAAMLRRSPREDASLTDDQLDTVAGGRGGIGWTFQ